MKTRMTKKFAYMLIGGGIGAAVALMFAPKRGLELREDLVEKAKKSYDDTLAMGSRLKDMSAEYYQQLRKETSEVLETAAAKIYNPALGPETPVESAKDAFNDTTPVH
jgi:gas vesicle protein